MRLIYRLLLTLYPVEYRAAFGREMSAVFEDSTNARQRGPLESVRFNGSELGSLILGAISEWFAKFIYSIYHSTDYVGHRCLADRRFMWPQTIDRRWKMEPIDDDPSIDLDDAGMCVNANQTFLFASPGRRLLISICKTFIPVHPR